ncbi:DUF2935 domain-containing protein [Paenibacillus sp. YPG26]|uniref:DUF2935 domain-containing protein n=1 Tax=Paenibacillus sp. YPG26 TaxID=2878915 RepID=UPI00203E5B84|nr:DUF2935 domain-containing protein [Paenibacillus sp. YPG26]USB33772.1 DUF2935 domain-containing protein [Paenibacillus sp. YPG26]
MSEVRSITIWEEHDFWLPILQDHAIFVLEGLAPYEKQWITGADRYIQAFGDLVTKLYSLPRDEAVNSDRMIQLAKEIWPVAKGYYEFEGNLQRLRINNEVQVSLSPTYFNGTLNENQEYLRQLSYYVQGQYAPQLSVVELLDLWLEDQLGHAILLRNSLDPLEREIIQRLDVYSAKIQSFIVQNQAMVGYLRFSPPGFKRQQLLAREVGTTVLELNSFINMVVTRYENTEVLNKTTLRFLEHHFPETCYFIISLSSFAPELREVAMSCSLKKPSFPQ